MENNHFFDDREDSRREIIYTPQYLRCVKSAGEAMKNYGLVRSDFWNLKDQQREECVVYKKLIIRHDACLKINEKLTSRFHPECVSVDKDGFAGSLVFTYICSEQGIYEIGEVSRMNCRNRYPYAIGLKRCFDRVVLKLSHLASEGIYSESESEEFVRFREASSTDACQIREDSRAEESKRAERGLPEPEEKLTVIDVASTFVSPKAMENGEMTLAEAQAMLIPCGVSKGMSVGALMALQPRSVEYFLRPDTVKQYPLLKEACRKVWENARGKS